MLLWLNCVSQKKRYVEVLNAYDSDKDFTEDEIIWMGPDPLYLASLYNGKFGHRQTHTEARQCKEIFTHTGECGQGEQAGADLPSQLQKKPTLPVP